MRKIILLVVMLIGLTATAQEPKIEFEVLFHYNLVEYVSGSGKVLSHERSEGDVIFMEYTDGSIKIQIGEKSYSLSLSDTERDYSKYSTPEGVAEDVEVLLYYNVLKIRINDSNFNYYINGYTELSYDK